MSSTQHFWTSCTDLWQMHSSRCSPDVHLICISINGSDSLLFRLRSQQTKEIQNLSNRRVN
jgi:hypothetical protein